MVELSGYRLHLQIEITIYPDDRSSLFNLSVTTCQIPATWKSSLIISISKPGKDTSQGSSYQPISLLVTAAKVMGTLILPTINKYILPAPDQHGVTCSIPEHSTTSALLQLKTYIEMGFNQRKPPDRTVCVAVDLSATFDTVYHNNPVVEDQRITDPSGHNLMAIMLS